MLSIFTEISWVLTPCDMTTLSLWRLNFKDKLCRPTQHKRHDTVRIDVPRDLPSIIALKDKKKKKQLLLQGEEGCNALYHLISNFIETPHPRMNKTAVIALSPWGKHCIYYPRDSPVSCLTRQETHVRLTVLTTVSRHIDFLEVIFHLCFLHKKIKLNNS